MVAGRRAGGAAKLTRVTARVVPGDLLRTPAVVAHGRVVVTGAEGTRLHEEIVTAGGLIEGGRLARTRQAELDSWLAAASEEPPGQPVRDQLIGLWPTLADPLRRALATRADQRARSLHGLLERRRDGGGHGRRGRCCASWPGRSRRRSPTPHSGSRPACSR